MADDSDALGDAIASAVVDAIDNSHADYHWDAGTNYRTCPLCNPGPDGLTVAESESYLNPE